MWECPQIDEREQILSGDDDNDCSSFGTAPSSEGFMEALDIRAAASEEGDMHTLIAAIAALSRGQAVVTDKLALLEKLVGAGQIDIAWVREDMKCVHQDIERVFDQVCDIRDAAAEVGRLKEDVSVDASPTPPWNGTSHAPDAPKAPSVSTTFGEPTCDDEDMHHGHGGFDDGGNYTQQTPPYENNPDTRMTRQDSPEAERYEWGYQHQIPHTSSSPPCNQMIVNIDKEPLEEESQQLQMSCQSTQYATPAKDKHMWADFTRAVRDWPPPVVAHTAVDDGAVARTTVDDRAVARTAVDDGWVSTKKGRWDVTVYGKDYSETGAGQEVEVLGNINLNLLPERHEPSPPTQGGFQVAALTCNAGTSTNGTGGRGRGRGRGRRPGAVQPRYHTPVRVGISITIVHVFAILQALNP